MSHRPIKAALLQIHSVIGLAVSLVLTVIGLTGAIMSFEDEIDAALNAAILRVEARPAATLMPDELIAILRATRELGEISVVTLASDPSMAVRVRFVLHKGASRPASFYLDPYDGHVLGLQRGEEFFATVRKLHRFLLLPGDGKGWGRIITGSVAICLIVMLITGLVLRWPRRARSVRMWLKPNLALRGRSFQWSLHSVIGTWVLLIYLTMALTGLWFSFEWYKTGATWLFARAPAATATMSAKAAPRPRPAEQSQASARLNLAWSVFLKEQGHRYATAQLQLPTGGATAMRIRSWARDITHDGARDEYRIDTVTGRVISAEIYEDKTFGERVLASVLDIHRGSILGWPGKLLFMLAAALMPLFMVTGLSLYLSRRKLRLARPAVSSLAKHFAEGRPSASALAHPSNYKPVARSERGD